MSVGPVALPRAAVIAHSRPTIRPSIDATVQRELLLSTHDSSDETRIPFDPHVDDGFRDSELPELRFADLDLDDPRATLPPRAVAVPRPKIRWWVDADDRVHVAVRPPAVSKSAVSAAASAKHLTTLEGVGVLYARLYPGVVRARHMWEALEVMRPVTSAQLSEQLKTAAVVTDGSNLSRLSPTVLQFPWGLTTLGTLTMLSASGSTRLCVEEMLELAAFLGEATHPERLSAHPADDVKREVARVRSDVATRWGSQAETLSKHQESLRGILVAPARVWAARTLIPITHWAPVAATFGKSVPEYLTVMAVAGAFDPVLQSVWTRTRGTG